MRSIDPARSDDRQPLTLTIPQAARILGISVSKAYEAARSGQLPTLRVGARVLISRRRLEELIDGPVGAPGHDPPENGNDRTVPTEYPKIEGNWRNRGR
jgi:excisionase family DNA binding protein